MLEGKSLFLCIVKPNEEKRALNITSWILFVAQASSLNSRMRLWMRAHIQISSAVTAGLGGAGMELHLIR